MTTISEVRPSPIAGRWYEGDPVLLASQVDGYLDQAELPELKGQVLAVIAPHAGHIYSGRTAGFAFRAVRGNSFPLVVIFSPLHGFHFEPLLTSAHKAYATPLGTVPIDDEAVSALEAALKKDAGLNLARIAYDQEHSLEIELPFLQRALKGEFKLLPVMVRSQEPQVARQLGLAAAEILKGKSCLLVASTDLSHFYDERSAKQFDAEMLQQFEAFSPDGIYQVDEAGKGFACGMAAVAAVFWAARALGGEVPSQRQAKSSWSCGSLPRKALRAERKPPSSAACSLRRSS